MGRVGTAAIAAACGAAAASLYLSVLLGSPGALILVYLTQLPLFAAGLWLGAGAAMIAGATACVALLAVADILAAVLFAALNAVPVILVVRQALLARRAESGALVWYPIGQLLALLTGLALIGMTAALLALGGPEGLKAELRDIVGHALDRLAEDGIANRDVIVATIAAIMPGVLAASWMVMTIANGCLAQGVLARFKVAWRPSADLVTLAVPQWMVILLGVASAASVFGGAARFIGINTMIALFVPFCLAGLAVLHAAVRRLSHPAPALVMFYVMAGLFGWPLLVAALFGLCEPWLGLRRRLLASGGTLDG